MGMTSAPGAAPSLDSALPLGRLAGIVRNIPSALITTIDPTGIIQTRLLPNTNTGDEHELCFLSPYDLPIVREVRERPDVLVTFSAPGSDRFVVVHGVARVERDRDLVERLWHPAIATWFPLGDAETPLAVLKVAVAGVEVWD
ncbi:MAG: pyridoxamine 5'-phosphate oxidase family protein [Gemmatimonadota bacterium]